MATDGVTKLDSATPEWLRGAVRGVGGVVGGAGGVVGGAVKGVGGVAGGAVKGVGGVVGGVAGGVGGVIVGRRTPVMENEDAGQAGPSRQRSMSPAKNRRAIDSYAPPPATDASGEVTPPRRTLQKGQRTTSVRFGDYESEAGDGGVEETPSKTPRSILKKQSSVSSKEGNSLRRDLSREM